MQRVEEEAGVDGAGDGGMVVDAGHHTCAHDVLHVPAGEAPRGFGQQDDPGRERCRPGDEVAQAEIARAAQDDERWFAAAYRRC